MAYLAISYPEFGIDDFDKIQNYRRLNDQLYYHVVKPHFTFVFPVFDFSEDDFIKEVKGQYKNETRFDFAIRCAVVRPPDIFSDYYHALLVPDEGFSNIVKLHDKLYSGKLKDDLMLDVDFVPHIGIGNSKDKFLCKKMVDEWNSEDFSITGSITQLSIIKYENDSVTTIEEVELE